MPNTTAPVPDHQREPKLGSPPPDVEVATIAITDDGRVLTILTPGFPESGRVVLGVATELIRNMRGMGL